MCYVYGEWIYIGYGNERKLFKMMTITIGQFVLIMVMSTILIIMHNNLKG